jgi:hypothetical protein
MYLVKIITHKNKNKKKTKQKKQTNKQTNKPHKKQPKQPSYSFFKIQGNNR